MLLLRFPYILSGAKMAQSILMFRAVFCSGLLRGYCKLSGYNNVRCKGAGNTGSNSV